jgi:hypothetical protein
MAWSGAGLFLLTEQAAEKRRTKGGPKKDPAPGAEAGYPSKPRPVPFKTEVRTFQPKLAPFKTDRWIEFFRSL